VSDRETGTDFAECEAGYITVTPLQIDLTDFDTMAQVAEFWQGVGR
jgi:5'-nucleotidase